ncbi:MAG: DMT family transporter [Oliverpabstia sp.]|nr:DMT family transporter [Eubacterium sp.]MDY2595834.1 DMT family transporter [Oliverpabstia sp.]
MVTKNTRGIFLAILAASLYAVNAPFSKILLNSMPSTLMAGFLYIGAGLGTAVIAILRKMSGHSGLEEKLTRTELPFTIAMIILDIAAPICLLLGLSMTTAANASLLNNFEIAATAFIALLVFKERISPRLWLGIIFVTVSCLILSFEDISSLHFTKGSLLVLLAACCWGLENNCTRKISSKDPLQIVLLKGIFSGGGSLAIGFMIGERIQELWSIPCTLLLGFIAYGLSIYTYVYAQRLLGASRTSAYYAIAPFIGVFLSLIIFQEIPGINFFIALVFMLLGAWLSSK